MPKSQKSVPDAETMDREIRATCKILESIAKSYPRGSAERVAVREATDAFIYVRLHEGLKQSYERFRHSCTKPLSKAQEQILKRAGIEI